MKIDFITSDRNTSCVCNLLQGKGPFKLAVAFWGQRSVEMLKDTSESVKIICNLESGATNPFAIEELDKNTNIEIRSCQTLHAKVYWTQHKAIVTSANASANGLSYEDDELNGWVEAGMSVVDQVVNLSIEQWFDALWNKSIKVTPAEIDAAKKVWARRRDMPRTPTGKKGSLLEALRKSPACFKDRRIYFVMWTEHADERDREVAENAATMGFLGLNAKNYDIYVNWKDLPDNAQFINFKLTPKGPVFIELTESFPRNKRPFLKGHGGSLITMTRKISSIDNGAFVLTTEDKNLVRKAGKSLWTRAGGKDESARFISLYEAREVFSEG